MFYQNDYITRTLQEQEIRERIQQAHIDHLLSEIQPHRSSQFSQFARKTVRAFGHLLLRIGKHLDRAGMRDARLARQ